MDKGSPYLFKMLRILWHSFAINVILSIQYCLVPCLDHIDMESREYMMVMVMWMPQDNYCLIHSPIISKTIFLAFDRWTVSMMYVTRRLLKPFLMYRCV